MTNQQQGGQSSSIEQLQQTVITSDLIMRNNVSVRIHNNQVVFEPCSAQETHSKCYLIKELSKKLLGAFHCCTDGVAGTLTVTWLILCLWGISYSLAQWKIPINSELLAFLLLLITTLIGGRIVKIIRLPPLLGMLLIGMVWRNWNPTPVAVAEPISTSWSVFFRNMAAVIILLRGGYGLNHTTLKSNWSVVVRLSLLPCLLESVCWAIGAFFLLNMPWMWGFLTGFVISAASAAVVIPMMLAFQEQGLGRDKGIPTICIAATSIDNVLAMAAFGIIHSFVFSTGNLLHNLSSIPIQIVVGVAFGFFWGLVLCFFPRAGLRLGHLIGGRFCLLLSGGVIAIFGGKALGYSGAGPLACVILAFIANVSWRHSSGWGNPLQPNPIADLLSGLWVFLEALLFGLIGTQIVIANLNLHLIGYGTLVMLLALAVRFAVSFIAVTRAGFSYKEMIFASVTWLPKATVQAALGPVALETARRLKAGAEVEQLASDVLTLAALSILITAPLGALAIQLCGPRLLQAPQPTVAARGTTTEIQSLFST